MKQRIARMGVETILKMVRSITSIVPFYCCCDRCSLRQPSSASSNPPVCAFQVFVDNFVHGDLHPGNILVQTMGKAQDSGDAGGISAEAHGKTTLTDLWDTVVVSVRPDPCPLQLVLLDAGIVAQLSEHDLANLRAVFTAVVLCQVIRA